MFVLSFAIEGFALIIEADVGIRLCFALSTEGFASIFFFDGFLDFIIEFKNCNLLSSSFVGNLFDCLIKTFAFFQWVLSGDLLGTTQQGEGGGGSLDRTISTNRTINHIAAQRD